MPEIRLSREELFFYPQMYRFYRSYPILAVRDIVGIKLAPHQRWDLRLQWQFSGSDIIRLMGRGMSKTFGEALYAILSAILYPSLRIISLGSGGFRQGKLILEEAEKIIKCECDGQEKNNFLLNMINTEGRRSSSVIKKEPDLYKIPWLNGSVIATAPITNPDAIRGFRTNVLQIDERKDLKKETKEGILKPMGIVDYNVVTQKNDYENKNIDSGTLRYEEDDYTKEVEEYLRLIKDGSEEYLLIQFIYPDAFDEAKNNEDYKYKSDYFGKKLKFWSVPYGIKVDDIERELSKLTTDIESWRAEHLCVPMRATGDYYSFELIQSTVNKMIINDKEYYEINDSTKINQYLCPKLTCNDPCVLGVDCAREHDMTAFVVLRLGPLSSIDWNPILQEGKTKFVNVIWAYAEKNMHDPDAAILIYKILDMFPSIKIVALDKRGGGSGIRDQLYHVVKDKKILDEKNKPMEIEILFDPEDDDEGGIVDLLRDERGNITSGNNRLRLLTYQDMDNTIVNRSIRNAMKEETFYFSGGDEQIYDEDLVSVRDYINVIPRQFRMIQTKPTKNWLHFEVPNPDKNLKDLYSATIYAWGETMKLIHDLDITKGKVKLPLIAPTFTLNIRR